MSAYTTTVPRIFSALRAFHASQARIRVGSLAGDLFGVIEDGAKHTPASMIVTLGALLNSQRLGWETCKQAAGYALLSYTRSLHQGDGDLIVLRDRIEAVHSSQSERELVTWLDHWGRRRCYANSPQSIRLVERELRLWKHAEDVFVARYESYEQSEIDHDTAVDRAAIDVFDRNHNDYAG